MTNERMKMRDALPALRTKKAKHIGVILQCNIGCANTVEAITPDSPEFFALT
jgi:hypothetical protein